MRKQFCKLLAMVMVLAMTVSMCAVGVFATETSYTLGDVNLDGAINVKDATLVQKFSAEAAELDEVQLSVADVNADGKTNVKDATAIQKIAAGMGEVVVPTETTTEPLETTTLAETESTQPSTVTEPKETEPAEPSTATEPKETEPAESSTATEPKETEPAETTATEPKETEPAETTATEPTTSEELAGSIKVYFTDNQAWGQVFCDYWAPTSERTMKTGFLGKTQGGKAIYYANVAADAKTIRFGDSLAFDGEKTVEISATDFDIVENAGFYAIEKVGDEWTVGTYTYGEGENVITTVAPTTTVPFSTDETPLKPSIWYDEYIVGYIDGVDYYDDYYEFVDGAVTVTFIEDSYIFVRSSRGGYSYMTEGLVDDATSAQLALESELTDPGMLFVPAGKYIVSFNYETLVLSYEAVLPLPPATGDEATGDEATGDEATAFKTFTIVGDGKTPWPEWLDGAFWDPGASGNNMELDSDGIYEITYWIPKRGEDYEFKIVADNSWDNNFGIAPGTVVEEDVPFEIVPNGEKIVINSGVYAYLITIKLDMSNYDYEAGTGAMVTVELIDPESRPDGGDMYQ